MMEIYLSKENTYKLHNSIMEISNRGFQLIEVKHTEPWQNDYCKVQYKAIFVGEPLKLKKKDWEDLVR